MKHYEMRRKDRLIVDPELIRGILNMCNFIIIGSNDDQYPYMVPLNFGFDITEQHLDIYIHSAKKGHKVDIWEENSHVTAVCSCFYSHSQIRYHGMIHDYRSVMACGKLIKLDPSTNEELYVKARDALRSHYNRKPEQLNIPYCSHCDMYIIRCDLENVTGKSEKRILSTDDLPFDALHEMTNGINENDPKQLAEAHIAKQK